MNKTQEEIARFLIYVDKIESQVINSSYLKSDGGVSIDKLIGNITAQKTDILFEIKQMEKNGLVIIGIRPDGTDGIKPTGAIYTEIQTIDNQKKIDNDTLALVEYENEQDKIATNMFNRMKILGLI